MQSHKTQSALQTPIENFANVSKVIVPASMYKIPKTRNIVFHIHRGKKVSSSNCYNRIRILSQRHSVNGGSQGKKAVLVLNYQTHWNFSNYGEIECCKYKTKLS